MQPTRWIRCALAALAAGVICAPAFAAGGTVPAVWVPRQVQFVYRGFTTRYSCGGLHDEIVRLLTRLGARDLKVREEGCVYGNGRPEPFPGVSVSMRVLIPATRAAAGAARVGARWHKVVLASGGGYRQGGQCELVAEFRRVFLPVFAARAIDLQAPCVPYEVNPGTYLSAEVLEPAQARAEPHQSLHRSR